MGKRKVASTTVRVYPRTRQILKKESKALRITIGELVEQLCTSLPIKTNTNTL